MCNMYNSALNGFLHNEIFQCTDGHIYQCRFNFLECWRLYNNGKIQCRSYIAQNII